LGRGGGEKKAARKKKKGSSNYPAKKKRGTGQTPTGWGGPSLVKIAAKKSPLPEKKKKWNQGAAKDRVKKRKRGATRTLPKRTMFIGV